MSRSPLRDLWRLSLEFLMDQSRQPAAVLAVDTWRWRGVPFRLRAGKALTNPRQEVVITFKKPPPIPAGFTGGEQPDRLHIGIALEARRLSIDLTVNGPDDPREIDPVRLGADLGPGELPAYGEILKSIFHGDPILSVRGDMAVESWRIIEPVLHAWRRDQVPLQEYPAGSMGPDGWPLSSAGTNVDAQHPTRRRLM